MPSNTGPIDLLPLVDLSQDLLEGQWSRTADGYTAVDKSVNSLLRLPVQPGEAYSVRVAFSINSGNFCMVLPIDEVGAEVGCTSRNVSLSLDGGAWADSIKTHKEFPFYMNGNKRHELLIEVTRPTLTTVRITAVVDGQPGLDWQGPVEKLKLAPKVAAAQKCLAVNIFLTKKSPARLFEASLTTTRGQAKPLRESAAGAGKYAIGGLGMEFSFVPRGKSWLSTQHGNQVYIPYDYYLGTYEVTQEEWFKVMGTTPSRFSRNGTDKELVKDVDDGKLKRFPVESVTFPEAQKFVHALNEKYKEADWIYVLPTSMEWEYACRGGPMADKSESTFRYYGGLKPTNDSAGQGNIDKKLNRPTTVGSYLPNGLGLHDMHGNVAEWCDGEHLSSQIRMHVLRGGYYLDAGSANHVNVMFATGANGSIGLRIARVPAAQSVPGTCMSTTCK